MKTFAQKGAEITTKCAIVGSAKPPQKHGGCVPRDLRPCTLSIYHNNLPKATGLIGWCVQYKVFVSPFNTVLGLSSLDREPGLKSVSKSDYLNSVVDWNKLGLAELQKPTVKMYISLIL